MARQARIVVPGAPHHITQRGNYGQDVFFTDDDRRSYLSFLRESTQKYGLRVTAYCLMTNHVHLVAIPEHEDSLARAMGRTHLVYAQYIHSMHERLGHLWQNRFYSCPMDDAHAHNAAAYVELNPVRAGMVRAPWDYPWSSAAAHCGRRGDSSRLLDLNAWHSQMPPDEWVETLRAIAKSNAIVNQVRLHTRTGRPLGSDSFLGKVEARLGRRVRATPRGRPKGSKDSVRRRDKKWGQ